MFILHANTVLNQNIDTYMVYEQYTIPNKPLLD
jgi:hypothetical protein